MTFRRSARISALPSSKDEDATAIPSGSTKKTQIKKRKASTALVPENSTPATPRKRAPKVQKAPPATPTPAAVGLLGEAINSTTPKSRARTVARLADPKGTNATLVSPSSANIVASKSLDQVSPSKKPAEATTTENILKVACNHLISIDTRLKPLISQHHCRVFSPEGLAETIDPFESLCSGIISQQVSGAAAKSIKKRLIALFDESATAKFPAPSEVSKTPLERLRTAGLSQRKAEYVQGLAQKFADGHLSARMLQEATYEEVLEKLIAVRGLGQWSVEMFACFGLKRMDVFSLGDLGVQRGMAAFVGRDINKLRSKGGKWKYMSEKEMQEISDKFAPYRSLFMWYMWRVEATDISTLE
ncbi:hypothetical protein MKZ38_010202 [Zalerion maritima]|uniref:HhH-GPD domain-containing protein n=1 Tax=Zalerion maritima TaxID=339359 RepID=A0AAD5WT36_9PEZI|nr:hypothetical protein MKZ38_010202 [Zalerion maritima]